MASIKVGHATPQIGTWRPKLAQTSACSATDNGEKEDPELCKMIRWIVHIKRTSLDHFDGFVGLWWMN